MEMQRGKGVVVTCITTERTEPSRASRSSLSASHGTEWLAVQDAARDSQVLPKLQDTLIKKALLVSK